MLNVNKPIVKIYVYKHFERLIEGKNSNEFFVL